MSSNLQQIQVNYEQVQDRLTLTIFTQDMFEYRFWITRRATKMLWTILTKLLESEHKDQLIQKQASQQIAKQIEEEKAQRRPIAQQFAHSATRKPLGEEPLLLFGIKAKPAEEGSSVILLQLQDSKGQSLQLAGDSKIILAMCQLIHQTVQYTDWDLTLKVPFEAENSNEE